MPQHLIRSVSSHVQEPAQNSTLLEDAAPRCRSTHCVCNLQACAGPMARAEGGAVRTPRLHSTALSACKQSTSKQRRRVSEGCGSSPLAGVDQGTIRQRRIGNDEGMSQAREDLRELAGRRRELQRAREGRQVSQQTRTRLSRSLVTRPGS